MLVVHHVTSLPARSFGGLVLDAVPEAILFPIRSRSRDRDLAPKFSVHDREGYAAHEVPVLLLAATPRSARCGSRVERGLLDRLRRPQAALEACRAGRTIGWQGAGAHQSVCGQLVGWRRVVSRVSVVPRRAAG